VVASGGSWNVLSPYWGIQGKIGALKKEEIKNENKISFDILQYWPKFLLLCSYC